MTNKQKLKGVKVYLASPFFSEEQVERVKRVEEALKANPTVTEVFSPRLHQFNDLPYGTQEWAEFIFKNDVKHVDWADVVVGVHDFTGETELHGDKHNHVDSGTAWELGYAFGTGKPVVMLHELDGIVNLMLSVSCQAYFKDAEAIKEYDFNEMPKVYYSGETW